MKNKEAQGHDPAALSDDALELISGGRTEASTCRYCGAPLEEETPGQICLDCKKKYTSANRGF